jgi:hypothetical protein
VVSAGTPTVTVTEGNGQYSVSKSLKGCHSSFCKLPIHWRAPLGVAHQGKSNCILSISKRLSRCLCPRREQKRKSATDCSDKFFFFVRRGLRKKKKRILESRRKKSTKLGHHFSATETLQHTLALVVNGGDIEVCTAAA